MTTVVQVLKRSACASAFAFVLSDPAPAQAGHPLGLHARRAGAEQQLAQTAAPRDNGNTQAGLSVRHGDYRYLASSTHAQLTVLRPDGSQFAVQLPAVASAVFIHEAQLYLGFQSGELLVFAVDGPRAAAPTLSLRHVYPHAVGGFALSGGQVTALPADEAPRDAFAPGDQGASRNQDRRAPDGSFIAPEPPLGVGFLVFGTLLGGGVGVPALAVGLNRRLDREGDGWGWIIAGGVGLGVGAILAGVGGAQATRHRRWARQNMARLTPTFALDPGQSWSAGARLRF